MNQELSTLQTTQQPIDRLFLKMSMSYGRHWLEMWMNLPISEVKAEWSEKLKENGITLSIAIKTIDHLIDDGKTFPPTLPEFLQHCKGLKPKVYNQALPHKYSEEELAHKREKLAEATSVLTKSNNANKAWAKRILANVENGIHYPDISIRFAKEAMGINDD